MRTFGSAIGGLVLVAGLALLVTLPQSAMSRAVDPQRTHLIGVLFVAVPLGAVPGLVTGLLRLHHASPGCLTDCKPRRMFAPCCT